MTPTRTPPEVLVTRREFRALLAEAEVAKLARAYAFNVASLLPHHRKAIGRALLKDEKDPTK
jgi:hypothetical protein